MLVRKHSNAQCPWCGTTLWYGLKAEVTGWKVQYTCRPQEGCGREFSPGRIDQRDIENEDEAYKRAESLGERLY